MKKNLIIKTLFVLALLFPLSGMAQNSLRLRFGGNATRFVKEQDTVLTYWEIKEFTKNFGPFDEFTHKMKPGAEAELMMSLSDKASFGIEMSMDKLYGENSNPGLYNFQYTDYLQLFSADPEGNQTPHITSYPLKYSTTLLNFMGNFRIYPFPDGRLRPFLKVSAGVSFIGTELALLTPSVWIEDIKSVNPDHIPGEPVLYSRGTSGAEKGKFPAFTFGGGIGFEFRITEKLSAYADYSLKVVNSDIVDGIPNFDWMEDTGKFDHFSTRSSLRKLSFGLVYTINDHFRGLGSGKGGGGGKGSKTGGRTNPHLPFYQMKRF